MNISKVHYIAGLLEGEGSFGFYACPVIQLQMTDLDVVDKARMIMSPETKIRTYNPDGNRIPIHHLSLSGSIVIQWVMTIYPLMGIRRKAKIREVVTKWKEMSGIKNWSRYNMEKKNPKTKLIRLIAEQRGISLEEATVIFDNSKLIS